MRGWNRLASNLSGHRVWQSDHPSLKARGAEGSDLPADPPHSEVTSEIDLNRDALLNGQVNHGRRDGQILQSDAGAIEHRDLVG